MSRFLLSFLLAGVLLAAGCSTRSGQICYTAISSYQEREYVAVMASDLFAVQSELNRLHAIRDDTGIAIAQRGSVYLMSTCGFQDLLNERYGERFAVENISKDEYDKVIEISSASRRLVPSVKMEDSDCRPGTRC
ncbi:MAG: hypothetical protein Q8J92_02935 [Parvibaculum sp.]|nr:hypothetical protein [Parvibaculum sp.]